MPPMPASLLASVSTNSITKSDQGNDLTNPVLERASLLLTQDDAQGAIELLQPCFASYRHDRNYLALLSECHADQGNMELATRHLQAACKLSQRAEQRDETDATRWLTLAQMQSGTQAVQSVRSAIAVLTDLQSLTPSSLSSNSHNTDQRALRVLHCQALINLFELYTTDCCDDDGAESICEESIAHALALRPESVEAHYCLANLRCIQQRDDEATQSLLTCISLLKKQADHDLSRMSVLSLIENQNRDMDAIDPSDDDADDAHKMVATSSLNLDMAVFESTTYETRLNIAKLAFELQLYSNSLTLLQELLQEDDRFIEVQHLLACALLHTDQAQDALTQSQHALSLVEEALNDDSSALQQDVHQQLLVAQKALTQLIMTCRDRLREQGMDAMEDAANDEDSDDVLNDESV